jgi:chitin-binding protein
MRNSTFTAIMLSLGFASNAMGHGLIAEPGSICTNAFANHFNAGYQYMAVLTHTKGRDGVTTLPQNVCSFDSETWNGGDTPWDLPLNWPTSEFEAGPRVITWDISWGPHFDDTEEFRYWITREDFAYQVGQPLSWSDFEAKPFCVLKYDDSRPTANPNVVADKDNALFHTQCDIPQRTGRHVIYGEWGRNQWTYERFHGCIDAAFGQSKP